MMAMSSGAWCCGELGLQGGLAGGDDGELSGAVGGGDDAGVEVLGGIEVLNCGGLGEAEAWVSPWGVRGTARWERCRWCR